MKSKEIKVSSIEEMLHEREKIEKSINEQFSEYVAIMFTDVAGYTHFVETHGDIAAKSLLQKHNEIVFSIIERHSGNIIKTIGDAVMASFGDPKDAVSAAVNIQNALKQYNKDADKIKKINIKIGIHSGKALKDGNDYLGDVVNIAARIEPTSSAGQIMVSKSVYNAIKDNKDIFCSFFGLKTAKGKSEPLEIYRVFLDREEQLSWKNQKEKENADNFITVDAKPLRSFNPTWKLSLPVIFFLILISLLPKFYNKFYNNADEIVKNYVDGFTHLRNGDVENARKRFLNIREDDPRHKEGLAAVAYRNQAYEEANQLSERSLKLNAGILYPRVIKGNILFDNGEFNEAQQLYTDATALESIIKWQKGEAFFRLGRISAYQNNPSEALAYYNEAIKYDDKNPDIITAKAVLLEKMGDQNSALESFQTALKLVPNDVVINAFYKKIQQNILAKQDKEQQDRIDKLIDELIRNMKEKKISKPSDRWTSRPITLFFAKMERKGTLPLKEGQDEFIKLEMTDRLRGVRAVNVVDRELLDKLLEELKISRSDLADPSTALELGRIMSARFIGNLTFMGSKNQTHLYLKLIETETSVVKIAISEQFDGSADLDTVVNNVVAKVADKIRSIYPVRGKINSVKSGVVLINVGSNMGVEEGMTMRVFSDGMEKKLIGVVKVVNVDTDNARGEIINEIEKINSQNLLEAAATPL